MDDKTKKIIKIDMLENSSENLSPENKQERAIAIYDLIENNFFDLNGHEGPYQIFLAKEARHLMFDIRSNENEGLNLFYLRIYIISLLYEFVCVRVLCLYCICNKMLLWTIYEISYYVNIISTRLQAARLFEKEGKIEKVKY